jgi:hypothetical protein
MLYTSRNNALGFARRTRTNLEYIERAFSTREDVHVITQLANSLLGLIVFPWEQKFADHIKAVPIDELVAKGWPQFEITKGECQTLGQLVRYLRHAVAHGRITFSSDSREINEVSISVENYAHKQDPLPNWSARLEARDLREFCRRFIDLIEDTIG